MTPMTANNAPPIGCAILEEGETEDEDDEIRGKADADPSQRSARAGDSDAEQDRPDEEEEEADPRGCEQRRTVDVVVQLTYAGPAAEEGLADRRLCEGADAEERSEEDVADGLIR